MNRASTDFSLRYALRAFRRRLPIFVLCVVLVPAAAVGFSLLQKKEYMANAILLFRDPQFDQKIFGAALAPTQPDPTRAAATNLDLVSLQKIAALTAARLHMTEEQVSSAVSKTSIGQSDLVSIRATARSPHLAAKLANTYAKQYIAFRRGADRAVIESAAAPLEQQIAASGREHSAVAMPTVESLKLRLSQLRVLGSLQTGGAELVQAAEVPLGPSSPKPVRNGAFGVFFGLLLAIASVLLAETLDRRLRDADEVEQIFERPLLASLPESSGFQTDDPTLRAASEFDREAFRMLWANLRYFTLSREIRSVLVTSPDRGDGKSTVSWGLGVAAANAGKRVLVIEADLRKPGFASRFNAPPRNGLSAVLAGDVTLADAVMRLDLRPHADDPRPSHSMDVLFAGRRPPDPTDLLQSRRMAEFVHEARTRYELIVIDTPPASVVSDAIPLITLVDGVVVVCRLGKTHREHARRLRQQLDNLDAPVLGLVVDSVTPGERYDYGYGRGPASSITTNGAHAATGAEDVASSLPPTGPATPLDKAEHGGTLDSEAESRERDFVAPRRFGTGQRLRSWLR